MLRSALTTTASTLALLALACLAACQGKIGDTTTDPDGPGDDAFELQPAVLPRLTTTQYRAALVDLLGEGLPETPIEPDTNPFLFTSIGATSTTLSELGVQQFEEAADAVTHAVFDDPARRSALVGCEPAAPGDACVEGFLRSFGRRALRRTLTEDEATKWVAVSVDLSGGDAWGGLRLAVAGLLQSPGFLYRVELGEPDPEDPARLRYTGFEVASRLSFLLWDTTPDAELLDAAENGELHGPAGIETQARRLLASPRARASLQRFFEQYLDLESLEGMTRDPVLYPTFSATMPDSMRTEALLLVDDVINRRDADIRELFSSRRTFVNAELAALYGVDAPGASAVAFVPVELPADGPRAGFLTSAAFLSMNAHEASTSPTLRGKYVRERVLCDAVPPPPPDVNTEIEPNPVEPKTLRERLDQHRENPACAGCHDIIDPPGYLFEGFDAVGAVRTTDNGYPVDTSGELDDVPLADARGLADLLADEERVGRCVTQQLFRHANGRLDTSGETAALDRIEADFAASGFRFRELVVALVTHESYRYVAPTEVSP